MKPFFSIIIPTLNEELFLPKLLKDLSNQKEDKFEVIVIDADSDDQTKDRAFEFQKKVPLSFYKVKKRNLSYQRNFGAKKAAGKFLIFLDADSRVNSTFIKKLRREVSKNKYLIFLPSIYPLEGSYSDQILFQLANFFIEVSQKLTKPLPTGSVMIFQKSCFEFLGGYKEKEAHDKKIFFAEDHELILRASKSGIKAKFLRNIKVGFSLRRMKNEGKFNSMRKYVSIAIEMTMKGDLDKNLSYEMGGHLYKKSKLKTQSSK